MPLTICCETQNLVLGILAGLKAQGICRGIEKVLQQDTALNPNSKPPCPDDKQQRV